MTTRSLTFHGNYRCRHSGACCTAGWPIPMEADRLEATEQAIRDGRLHTATAAPLAFIRRPGAPIETPAILATSDEHGAHTTTGPCVFFEPSAASGANRASGSGRCRLQRALGHAALPLACRQFPRVSVVDPRGVSVTLSHYCPTAAGLLHDDSPARIVLDSPALPADAEYVGLDARTSLPPLLRPDMLMGWEDWWEWEARTVAVIAAAPTADAALDALTIAVEWVRTWTPAEGPLGTRLSTAFERAAEWLAADATVQRRRMPKTLSARLADVVHAIPDELRPANTPATDVVPSPIERRNFLAAHAFANWTGYLGLGLRAWLRSLETADALLAHGLGVRQADLLLRHLADPFALADRWNAAEHADWS